MPRPGREEGTMRPIIGAVVLATFYLAASSLAVAAGIRDIYLTNAEAAPGARLHDREPLPGTHVTTFTAGQDKRVWLVILFGDSDAHHLRGELKTREGAVITVMDRDLGQSWIRGSWHEVRHWFSLERLRPGEYALHLSIAG